jgi:putative nucleotidyltransferase with HDIG domain
MSDIDYIRKLFPEIDYIKDEEIKKKVAEVWIRIWKNSKWKRIEDCVFNPVTPNVSLVNHIRTVTIGAIEMANMVTKFYNYKINMDYLIAACLLHDASKLLEYEMKDGKVVYSEFGQKLPHAFLGASYALEAGLPLEIVHLISTHTTTSALTAKAPVAKEGIILYHVDMLLADICREEAGAKPLYQTYLSKVVIPH